MENLSKDLGIQPASVRVALRKAGIKTPYQWEDRAKYDSVKDKLGNKARKKKPTKKAAKKKPAPKKEPAKKEG